MGARGAGALMGAVAAHSLSGGGSCRARSDGSWPRWLRRVGLEAARSGGLELQLAEQVEGAVGDRACERQLGAAGAEAGAPLGVAGVGGGAFAAGVVGGFGPSGAE